MANADSVLKGLEGWPGEALAPHSSCEGLYFLVEVKGLLTLGKEIYFFNYGYCKWASQP